MRYLVFIILAFVLYVLLGIILSYNRHPQVSKEYQENFDPKECYSDQASCDRACVIEDNEEGLRCV